MSFVDKDLLNPNCQVLLLHKTQGIVGVLWSTSCYSTRCRRRVARILVDSRKEIKVLASLKYIIHMTFIIVIGTNGLMSSKHLLDELRTVTEESTLIRQYGGTSQIFGLRQHFPSESVLQDDSRRWLDTYLVDSNRCVSWYSNYL
jgi:hypothetical protein